MPAAIRRLTYTTWYFYDGLNRPGLRDRCRGAQRQPWTVSTIPDTITLSPQPAKSTRHAPTTPWATSDGHPADELGHRTTTYQYDNLGRKIEEIDPDPTYGHQDCRQPDHHVHLRSQRQPRSPRPIPMATRPGPLRRPEPRRQDGQRRWPAAPTTRTTPRPRLYDAVGNTLERDRPGRQRDELRLRPAQSADANHRPAAELEFRQVRRRRQRGPDDRPRTAA